MFILLSCSFFICLFSKLCISTNFYISENGNDNNGGKNINSPWKTIEKLNDYSIEVGFDDGDVIHFKRGSIWRNDKEIGVRGVKKPVDGLTIRDYGDPKLDKPTIDCTTQSAFNFNGLNYVKNLVIMNFNLYGMGWDTTDYSNKYLLIRYVENLTLDGIIIDGHIGTTNYRITGEALSIRGAYIKGDIIVRNCEISNMILDGRVPGIGECHNIQFGINFYTSYKVDGKVLIENCKFRKISGDVLQCKNMDSPTIFRNNYVEDYSENVIDLKSCSNWTIENNIFIRGDQLMTAKYWDPVGGTCATYLGDESPEQIYPNRMYNGPMIVAHDGDQNGIPENYIIRGNKFIAHGDAGKMIALSGRNIEVYNNYFEGRMFGFGAYNISVHSNIFNVTTSPNRASAYYPSDNSEYSLIKAGSTGSKLHHNTFYIKSNTMSYCLTITRTDIYNNVLYIDSTENENWVNYFYGAFAVPKFSKNIHYNAVSNQIVKDNINSETFLLHQVQNWNDRTENSEEKFMNPHFSHAPNNLRLKNCGVVCNSI